MESKGRRASRLAAPAERPAAPFEAAETGVPAVQPREPAIEAPHLAEVPAEPVEPMGTASGLAVVSEAEPSGEASKPKPFQVRAAAPARASLAPWVQAQAALARGLEALSAEMAGLALKSMDATASAASKLLGVKTLSDAIAVNAGFTCSSLDTLLGGSVRLSELGVRLAAETSQPLLGQFGGAWMAANRLGR